PPAVAGSSVHPVSACAVDGETLMSRATSTIAVTTTRRIGLRDGDVEYDGVGPSGDTGGNREIEGRGTSVGAAASAGRGCAQRRTDRLGQVRRRSPEHLREVAAPDRHECDGGYPREVAGRDHVVGGGADR